jgi:hypothetical protein
MAFIHISQLHTSPTVQWLSIAGHSHPVCGLCHVSKGVGSFANSIVWRMGGEVSESLRIP